jgi:hypothetical protein
MGGKTIGSVPDHERLLLLREGARSIRGFFLQAKKTRRSSLRSIFILSVLILIYAEKDEIPIDTDREKMQHMLHY